MAEFFSFISILFSGLGFLEMLIILLGTHLSEDYFINIMHPDGTVDNNAQAMFIFFVLSFLSICLKEALDYYKEKHPEQSN